jgi:hypothetical protein
MPRSIDGHGSVSTRYPPPPLPTGVAVVVDHRGADPGQCPHGRTGLARGHAGSGLIIMAPVSVCHQVSTIGQRRRR